MARITILASCMVACNLGAMYSFLFGTDASTLAAWMFATMGITASLVECSIERK